MKKSCLILALVIQTIGAIGQLHLDHLGAGNVEGVTITASHQRPNNTAIKSLDGSGLDAQIYDAGRFLSQATFGPRISTTQTLTSQEEYRQWIEDQMQVEYGSIKVLYDSIYQAVKDLRIAAGQNPNMAPNENPRFFNYTWTQANMNTNAELRHKVAYSLSQIFVISMNSKLSNQTKIRGVADYYQMLLDHSFGNFRDLLEDVAFHPAMGYYLTHMNNSRAFPEDNIFPDENFAREIMQLFTIGIHQLNPDGSQVLDTEGRPVPTYDNSDINELAKVFTGLGPGAVAPHVDFLDDPFFGLNINQASVTTPMIMYDFFHEPGEKMLPDGTVIPAGQPPLEDIGMALDWLFNHPNTGPFICHKLIQRLVKSNPSSDYQGRVAAVFADNGNGVRGDLGAVIMAILMDEEARSPEGQFSADAGRLKEPLQRQMNAARALATNKEHNRYWDNGLRWNTRLRQAPMFAGTVFNYYLPDYTPGGEIGDNNLVGPEYQIHFTSSAIDYVNMAYRWGWTRNLLQTGEALYGDTHPTYDLEEFEDLATSPDLLINELDKRLTYGRLSDATRGTIREAINSFSLNQTTTRVRTAIYLVLMSAEFAVLH